MKRIELTPVKRCGKCYRLIPQRLTECPYCEGTYSPVEVEREPEPEVEEVPREPMSEETKKRIKYGLIAVAALAVVGIGVKFAIDAFSKKPKTEEVQPVAEEKATEEKEVEESPYPETPECDVRGNLSGFGSYRLVVHEGSGEICPGEYGKEGMLNEVEYDKASGKLSMNAYTMRGMYCGRYEGVLEKDGDKLTYTGDFINTHGKHSSFVMK